VPNAPPSAGATIATTISTMTIPRTAPHCSTCDSGSIKHWLYGCDTTINPTSAAAIPVRSDSPARIVLTCLADVS